MHENDEDFQQEFDDWSVRGAEENRRQMEASFAEDRAREAELDAQMEAEGREFDARQKQKDELVKELIELRKTYDPLRQQIEEKEEILLHLYGWDWAEGDPDENPYDPHPGYPEGATEEQMQAQDMAGEIGYDPVTIEGYRGTPKVEEPKAHEVQPPEDWRTRVIREAKESTEAFVKERAAAELNKRFQGLVKKNPDADTDSIPF